MQIFYEDRKISVSLFSPQLKTILLRSSKEVELCVILPAPLTFKIELNCPRRPWTCLWQTLARLKS